MVGSTVYLPIYKKVSINFHFFHFISPLSFKIWLRAAGLAFINLSHEKYLTLCLPEKGEI